MVSDKGETRLVPDVVDWPERLWAVRLALGGWDKHMAQFAQVGAAGDLSLHTFERGEYGEQKVRKQIVYAPGQWVSYELWTD